VATVLSPGNFTVPDPEGNTGSPLEIFVPFTTERGTFAALHAAFRLSVDLRARIEMIAPEIVPYPLPLNRPPVALSFLENRYRSLLEQCGVAARIQIRLCRRPREAIACALKSESLVVIGASRRWWPTEERLCGWLRSQGHFVIIVRADSAD
jgi:hypothetical protein